MAENAALTADSAQFRADSTAVEAAAPKTLSDLHDELTHILRLSALDDLLAASLACRQLNAARLTISQHLTTTVRSTLRSEPLRVWAHALGCPSPYPHWAMLHGLSKATHLNGQIVRVDAPPCSETGRQPVQRDADLASQQLRRGLCKSKPVAVKPQNIALIEQNLQVARIKVLDSLLPRQCLRISGVRAALCARPAQEGLTLGIMGLDRRRLVPFGVEGVIVEQSASLGEALDFLDHRTAKADLEKCSIVVQGGREFRPG